MFSSPLKPSDAEILLTQLINQDTQRSAILLALKQLEIKNLHLGSFFIAAGFLRNLYWDHMHGYSMATPLADVDVVYFDEKAIEKEQDLELEKTLKKIQPKTPWSVKNQARMHYKSGHVPYTSLNDALSNWVETATAIGVRIGENNHLDFIAPWGYQDLFALVLRPTPFFEQKLDVFHQRIQQKQWLEKWPKLRIISDANLNR